MLNDKDQLLVDGKRMDDMVTVDGKDERLGDGSDLVDQGGHPEVRGAVAEVPGARPVWPYRHAGPSGPKAATK